MNITRHNYEECFILYMDNELDTQQRLQVEAFVKNNPDLKEELDILLQYKLVPDTAIVYENKSQLIKPEDHSPLHLANFEEWLVLYLDNELSPAHRILVEEFIHTQPEAKKEWALLQRTRLQPEPILFTGKESLYRKEAKRIPIRWWRVAAAVLLILAAGITLFIMLNKGKTSGKNELVNNSNIEQRENKQTPAVLPGEEKKEQAVPVIANTVQQKQVVPKPSRNELLVKQKAATRNEKIPVQIQNEELKKEPVIVQQNIPQNNNLPQPLNNPNVTDPKNALVISRDPSANNNQAIPEIIVTNSKPVSSEVIPAVYKETLTPLEQPEGKKSKLRGFFRKLARTFEKTTNINATDDNRLLIGGLAIKLK